MADARARESLEIVGLDYEALKDRSPFQLSGGQMRRVAIAGVLAMQPKVLVLDEPTAGLDPAGRKAILEGIYRIHREQSTDHAAGDPQHGGGGPLRRLSACDGRWAGCYCRERRTKSSRRRQLRELSLDVPETVALVPESNQWLPDKENLPLLPLSGRRVDWPSAGTAVRAERRSAMSMLQNIAIGQYVPGHSFLHRADPRSKLLFIILFATLGLFGQ